MENAYLSICLEILKEGLEDSYINIFISKCLRFIHPCNLNSCFLNLYHKSCCFLLVQTVAPSLQCGTCESQQRSVALALRQFPNWGGYHTKDFKPGRAKNLPDPASVRFEATKGLLMTVHLKTS